MISEILHKRCETIPKIFKAIHDTCAVNNDEDDEDSSNGQEKEGIRKQGSKSS